MARYEGLDGYGREWTLSAESLTSKVAEMLSSAYEVARRYGKVVGRISRFGEVKVEEGAKVEFEIDPQVYYSEKEAPFHRVGDYLAVIDPKTLKVVLVRVSSIVRRDELAQLGLEPPLSSFSDAPDPKGLLTRTVVYGEVIVEMDPESGEVRPATTSLEPQSPVVDPKPEVLERLLDLPREGVPLGALATAGSLVKNGSVVVRMPLKAFYQHVLIIGTTGSGKTTAIKNLVASLYSLLPRSKRPVAVIVDMNQDFIQLPLPPQPQPPMEPEATIKERIFKGVRPPRGVVAVVPVTYYEISEALNALSERGVPSYLNLMERIAYWYYVESFSPLTGGGAPARVSARRTPGGIVVEMEGPGFKVIFVPYIVNTTCAESDSLSGLMPGLTQLARDLLRRLRERVRRRGPVRGCAGPLQVLYGSLQAYHEASLRRGGMERDEEIEIARESMMSWIMSSDLTFSKEGFDLLINGKKVPVEELIDFYLDALHEIRPHKGTLEALMRRVGSLLDSGIVDVIVRIGEDEAEVLSEPSWEWVIDESYENDMPIVLDLKWSSERSLSSVEGPRLAAYRMLERLIAWKQRAWALRKKTPNVLVIIDEAHQFFPQEKGAQEEKEASRQVAGMIAKIARLGRARGVGILFSTHSPGDLHDIILQLSNTKIILRTDKTQAEHMEVPSEVKPYLPRLPDRHMLVMSHVFKEGYVFVRTTTPLTMHYDISAENA
jgi:DNA helicase HerA-like ATPase